MKTLVATALISSFFCLILSNFLILNVGANSSFSIVWITDTQYLSQYSSNGFYDLCKWIVDNQQKYNIIAVIHTGDIVQFADNATMWERANYSMSILLENHIPYCWLAGNHDLKNDGSWIGGNYKCFNSTYVYSGKNYWAGSFDDKNNAIKFSVSGFNLLIICFENLANETILNWGANLLVKYPGYHAILCTHAYLYNGTDYYPYEWCGTFKTYTASYENVFLTLCGHFHYSARKIEQFEDHTVINLQYDFQEETANFPYGTGYLRILNFDLDRGELKVYTFNPYLKIWKNDPQNQFVIDFPFFNPIETAFYDMCILLVSAIMLVTGFSLIYRGMK